MQKYFQVSGNWVIKKNSATSHANEPCGVSKVDRKCPCMCFLLA